MNENAKIRQMILEVLYKVREAETSSQNYWVCGDPFDIEPQNGILPCRYWRNQGGDSAWKTALYR
jgi:hypothetical protein